MAAFTKAGFFDYSVNGDTYSAADFAKVMFSLNGDGVDARYGNCLACTGSTLEITVDSGAAWLQGYFGWNDTSTTLTETSGTRKDYICVHVEPEDGTFELCIVQGTSTDFPTLTGNNYMPIYQAVVSSSTVTLTDCRSYTYGNSGIDKQHFYVESGTITPTDYPDGSIIFKPTLS